MNGFDGYMKNRHLTVVHIFIYDNHINRGFEHFAHRVVRPEIHGALDSENIFDIGTGILKK